MKQYANDRIAALSAYVPGEQPRDMKYIKLNTNESPFPPSPHVAERISGEEARLNLYPDPACSELAAAAAAALGVGPENLIFTNGSDELLNFAFLAFCDAERGIVFPDITYGLYPVLCEMYGIPYRKIPVGADFGINPQDFFGIGQNVVIANPNAPTGLVLSVSDIELIVRENPGRVVIVDEAYIAFGGESCVGLIKKYDNLLVARTFSKSHSLAGARLGMGIGSAELIGYLNKVKYSFNPYSINRITLLAGLAAFEDENYYIENCKEVIATRERVKAEIRALGFTVTDSKANFLFAKSDRIGGRKLYDKLRQCGVLVRHFDVPGISDYNRITIGSKSQMEAFLDAVRNIINDREIIK
ncbi:MAG TPA: histidinol-phosphate transaminase [Clostridiales bacterium]|jgi:histidinol-phosphate aminotransferase|nr:histidinol-phosphate transaminase [Clostridiales bacterium]